MTLIDNLRVPMIVSTFVVPLIFLGACSFGESSAQQAGVKGEGHVFNTAFIISQPARGEDPRPYPNNPAGLSQEKLEELVEENALALGALAEARVFAELGFSDVAAAHGSVGLVSGVEPLEMMEQHLSRMSTRLQKESSVVLTIRTHGTDGPIANSQHCGPWLVMTNRKGAQQVISPTDLTTRILWGIEDAVRFKTLMVVIDSCGINDFAEELINDEELAMKAEQIIVATASERGNASGISDIFLQSELGAPYRKWLEALNDHTHAVEQSKDENNIGAYLSRFIAPSNLSPAEWSTSPLAQNGALFSVRISNERGKRTGGGSFSVGDPLPDSDLAGRKVFSLPESLSPDTPVTLLMRGIARNRGGVADVNQNGHQEACNKAFLSYANTASSNGRSLLGHQLIYSSKTVQNVSRPQRVPDTALRRGVDPYDFFGADKTVLHPPNSQRFPLALWATETSYAFSLLTPLPNNALEVMAVGNDARPALINVEQVGTCLASDLLLIRKLHDHEDEACGT